MVKLLPRDDAHPQLFDAYEDALRALSSGAEDAPELRRFEQTLLKELGYGLTLDVDARSGARVVDDREYVFWIERGPVERDDGDDTASVSGKTLLDMVADDYSDARTRFESKGLMRQLIAHHLSGRPLHSRRVFYSKTPGKTPTSYTIDHSAGVFLYDPQGRIRLFGAHGYTVDAYVNDIRALLAG